MSCIKSVIKDDVICLGALFFEIVIMQHSKATNTIIKCKFLIN